MSNHDASESNCNEAKKEFEYIIKSYILPLIPTRHNCNLRLVQNCKSAQPIDKLICYENQKKCFVIYPCLKNPQIYIEIDSDEIGFSLGAAESILRAIMDVSQYSFSDDQFLKESYVDLKINEQYIYRMHRYAVAFELGLCQWLGGMAIYRLLDKMNKWAKKTYEGKRIPFSFIIDAKNIVPAKDEASDFIEFLDNNHSAVFTDGLTSGIALDNSGKIIKYFSSTGVFHLDNNRIPFAPYRFADFANKCRAEGKRSEWIGIISQINGDLLVFKNSSLVFAKRNGEWFFVDSNRIIQKIMPHCMPGDACEKETKKSANMFAKEVYLSLLDVSFSHTGGCFAVIYNEEKKSEIINSYIRKDYLDELPLTDIKRSVLKNLLCADPVDSDRIFYRVDRKLRQDLLGLDGATVVDVKGRILGAGAIVKIDGGSDEGGRTAAARQLSRYGLGIKVSMDGSIKGFVDETEIFSLF